MKPLAPRRPRRRTPPLLAALLWVAFVPQTQAGLFAGLFAPKAELWDRWEAHDASDSRTIDHGRWADFLSRHVIRGSDGINRIDYAGVAEQDRSALRVYIDDLAGLEISRYSRPAQFGYWVNLYNALTVYVVLEHWPVDSIRDIDISPGLFADGPWKKKLVEVEGEPVSLDDIEHRILRPIWRDPRIHYAVNCASIGCPNLQPEAFTADNTARLLDAAAREYVNHARGVEPTPDGLLLSSIYEWFADDFTIDGGVVAHLRRYAAPELRSQLGASVPISGHGYDWGLNHLSTR